MGHSVAIWTQRNQIARGIHDITSADLRNRRHMVNVDETLAERTVNPPKIESTDFAAIALKFNAICAIHRVSFIAVHLHSDTCSLRKSFGI